MAEKTVITNLERRIEHLIDDHKRLSTICRELTDQCERLKKDNRSLEQQLKDTRDELQKAQLIEGLAGGGHDRDKARLRVNQLMREVDKCIALVGGRLNSLSE